MFKPIRKSLPDLPGVYIYKDKLGNIIYIGKAKSLKNRVMSYFTSKHENSPKTQFLVKNITSMDFIVVDNEVEALLLENKLIKKHKPKFNLDLKDAKTYAYIKITDERIPKILSTRKVTKNGEYFGPFTDGSLRREIVVLVSKLFNLVTPKTFTSRSSLYYQIGLSPAKSEDEVDLDSYLKKVEEAKEFLRGKKVNAVLKRLKDEMKKCSDELRFEEAMEKKKYIESIEHMKERQKVDLMKNFDQDVVVMVVDDSQVLIEVLNISRGVISSKKDYKLDFEENVFEEFLRAYYSSHYVPKEIIVSEVISESEVFEEFLKKIRGSKVSLVNPQRGDKLSLVKLGLKNAKLQMKNDVLALMKKAFGLPKLPKVVECFDMSNLGKDYLVGGMTRWVDGKRDESGFRKFEIKGFSGRNDDFASMREVVFRRYKRLKEEKKDFPSLIIVDGGKGQLGAALDALRVLRVDIPIIGVAKGSKRDKNEIYLVGRDEPLLFDDNSQMMLFVRQVRDSVHNFVISYNRKKREMRVREEFK